MDMYDFQNELQNLNMGDFQANQAIPWEQNQLPMEDARQWGGFGFFNCFSCFFCFNCFSCSNCFRCSNCFNCSHRCGGNCGGRCGGGHRCGGGGGHRCGGR
jgi:heterocycloanthracin/sonorensin family bacteriocin